MLIKTNVFSTGVCHIHLTRRQVTSGRPDVGTSRITCCHNFSLERPLVVPKTSKKQKNYQHFERSPPFFFSRVARRNFFEVPLSREAQRNCFCLSARSAEKIFLLIHAKRGEFFLEITKIQWPTSLCKSAHFLTKICNFLALGSATKESRGPKLQPQVGRRLEQGQLKRYVPLSNKMPFLFRAKRGEIFFGNHKNSMTNFLM